MESNSFEPDYYRIQELIELGDIKDIYIESHLQKTKTHLFNSFTTACKALWVV
jgi:hypothetical protein